MCFFVVTLEREPPRGRGTTPLLTAAACAPPRRNSTYALDALCPAGMMNVESIAVNNIDDDASDVGCECVAGKKKQNQTIRVRQ